MSYQQLDQLVGRGQRWLEGESGWDVHYALFSRSGFNQPLHELAASERQIHLFTPESILTAGTIVL